MYERAEGVYGETVRWPDELAATAMEVVEGKGGTRSKMHFAPLPERRLKIRDCNIKCRLFFFIGGDSDGCGSSKRLVGV